MKRKIYSIIACFVAVMTFVSCNLDPKVYSTMTDSNFPKSLEDANELLTGLYGQIKNNSGGVNDDRLGGWEWPYWSMGASSCFGFNEVTTDETYYYESTQLRDFEWGAAENTMGTFNLIRNIARTTNLLDVLEKLRGTEGADDETINRMEAEAKVIRAQIMYGLFDLYGPVPMAITKEEVDKGEYLPRPTEEKYRSQMVKDLTEALPYLYGKTQGTSNWGRVNRGMADMLLMKIYMNNHEWTKAQPYAEDVTTFGYKLSDDYFEPFYNEQSDETIWAIPSGSISDNEIFYYTIPSSCNNVCGLDVAPYWGTFTSTWEFYNTFTDQDVRKQGFGTYFYEYKKDAQTNKVDTILHTRENSQGRGELAYGPLVVKYKISKDLSSTGRFHQVCYRYADVILSLAEIENNTNGPTDKAMNYLRMITDRAGTTSTIPTDIQSSKDKFNEFLLAERGRELYLEGWRRQDMIRFGTFISDAVARGKVHAADYKKLLPIPSNVITESGGIVKQNPGYETDN